MVFQTVLKLQIVWCKKAASKRDTKCEPFYTTWSQCSVIPKKKKKKFIKCLQRLRATKREWRGTKSPGRIFNC